MKNLSLTIKFFISKLLISIISSNKRFYDVPKIQTDGMTEYEKRALNPCWQHKQECICMFPIDSHNTSYLYLREDGTYYWQHCRKEAEDDVFIDADGIQLDLFGKPVLNKEFIMKEILSV